MPKMPKMKFDLQEMMGNLKSIVGSAVSIPEIDKDNPLGYILSELVQVANELTEVNKKQSEEIVKLNGLLTKMQQIISDTAKGTTAPSEKETPEVTKEEPKASVEAEPVKEEVAKEKVEPEVTTAPKVEAAEQPAESSVDTGTSESTEKSGSDVKEQ